MLDERDVRSSSEDGMIMMVENFIIFQTSDGFRECPLGEKLSGQPCLSPSLSKLADLELCVLMPVRGSCALGMR